MITPFEISDRFTDAYAGLDPTGATIAGIDVGREHLSTDYSPEGHQARTDLFRTTRDELARHLDHPDEPQAFAATVLTGWLEERLLEAEHRWWSWDLNHTFSPFQQARDVFDVMHKGDPAAWEAIKARLEAFPSTLDGYARSLSVGIAAGEVVARRQAESVLEQAEEAAADDSRFLAFSGEAAAVGADPDAVAPAVELAMSACRRFADWLRSDYLPVARQSDAVGVDRYLMGTDQFLGMRIDPIETYDWGWSELHRLRGEMKRTAAEFDSSMTLDEIVALLDHDPDRSAATRQEFVDFVQGVQQQAIAQLDGVHFDVPEQLKRVTVNIAPLGGALGAWYVGPSEDGYRSGSIWYSPGERERLPYWQEVSTAYHEGFPGHHLQAGTAVLLREKLSRAHRMLIWYAGAGEGWALYAERLMDELGFFEKPEYRLGMLASQLFRAARVVVDIGCQLELAIPGDAPLHAGDTWGYHQAVDYMEQIGLTPHDVSESEVKRYLGWIGQAISYKVGEREILDIRDDAMRREGGGFDRRDFHRRMLEAGAIRLDHLRQVMS
ncbi:MAG: DUF885 domain-containing protein [Acidimicrobiia bacterium]